MPNPATSPNRALTEMPVVSASGARSVPKVIIQASISGAAFNIGASTPSISVLNRLPSTPQPEWTCAQIWPVSSMTATY
jgi:hypothetical protein